MELYIEPIRPTFNKVNGQFFKGHEPFNKGKKWSEWMDGRKQKKVIRIAMKNLRPNPNICAWNKKQVIAFKSGEFAGIFESSRDAARKLNLFASLIRKVCRGERTHTGGYVFFHEENYEQWKHLIEAS